ncbi:hypothetical protein ACT4US_17910, partial [Bacillus sp. HC-Mk]
FTKTGAGTLELTASGTTQSAVRVEEGTLKGDVADIFPDAARCCQPSVRPTACLPPHQLPMSILALRRLSMGVILKCAPTVKWQLMRG